MAAIQHREPLCQSKEWFVVHVLVDTCADEHVCSPRDFEWIASHRTKQESHLVSASGHKVRHCDEQSVSMKPRDGPKIWITGKESTMPRTCSWVVEQSGPGMSVESFFEEGELSWTALSCHLAMDLPLPGEASCFVVRGLLECVKLCAEVIEL